MDGARSVFVRADSGRDRSASFRRGKSPRDLPQTRRATHRGWRSQRHGVRRVGAERAARECRRRFQPLGRPGASDAKAARQRRVGNFSARRGRGRALQVRDQGRAWRVASEERSVRVFRPARHRDGVARLRSQALPMERRRVDAQTARCPVASPAGVDLRSASRLVGEKDRGGKPLSQLPGTGRRAHRLRRRDGLHAHRVDARGGASVRRLVGLSSDRLLRADKPVRESGRVPALHRPLPPARHWRDPRLGAGAFPERRARPRGIRRHRAVRARRSAPGRAPGLGHAHFQLRPQRGAQFPHRERALLARGVSHRRPARGRRRLDAVPRLLAPSRASGFRIATAAARISRRFIS